MSNPVGQVPLLQAYFDKLHTFYDGTMPRSRRGLAYADDEWSYDTFLLNDIRYAYPNYEAMTHPDVSMEDYRDNRLTSPNYEFIQLVCHSGPLYHNFTDGRRC